MALINEHYLKLTAGYLFPEVARRVTTFAEKHPGADIIKLGIGDVTEPLPPAVIEAMHEAVDEMSKRETFRGYGPEQGYDFLREKIARHEYKSRGCRIDPDEIYISDGSKCDTSNILDILGRGNTIAVLDPVYPAYVDTNVMAGNTGNANDAGRYDGLIYLPATAENQFMPALPSEKIDVIYLCYPNNPTGAVASREALAAWVGYARQHDAIILYDAAYEAFITDATIPHSIYEIEGAAEVAIEFRSFSKKAGFTGNRCAFTVVPRSVAAAGPNGERVDLHRLWHRRQTTRFNGVSYVIQRGAEAIYSEEGNRQVQHLIDLYMTNARIVRETLTDLDMTVYGGVNAPYVWLKTPQGFTSWDFFDKLLSETHIVGTPGSGFGACGEGYFRISAFNQRKTIEEAMQRLRNRLSR